MKQKNRYAKRAKISEAKFRLLIRYFSHDLEAKTIAALMGLNRNTINRYLSLIRQRIADHCEHQSPAPNKSHTAPFQLEDRQNKESQPANSHKKTVVFGICKYDGKVYTQIIPGCTKAKLQAIVRDHITAKDPDSSLGPDRTLSSGAWLGYDSLVDLGYKKHYRVDCDANCLVPGKSHHDSIESFLAFAKNRLVKFHGIAESNFYLHLKECEFRFNYHDKDLGKLLLKMLRENPLS